MTLCVLLRDGDAGVLLADRRTIDDSLSSNLLISDTMKKIVTKRNHTYRVAITGAGDDSIMAEVYRRVLRSPAKSVEDTSDKLQECLWDIHEEQVARDLRRKQHEFERKARLSGTKERKEFLRKRMDEIVSEEFDEDGEEQGRDEYDAEYLFMGQDGNGLHPSRITRWKYTPLEGSRLAHAIGTGWDLAVAYLNSTQAGWGASHPARDLLLAAMNAFQLTTVNPTIGGTPDVILFDHGMRELTRVESSTLMNLCGAYQADLVSRRSLHAAADGIIEKDKERSIAPLVRIGETPAAIFSAGLPLRIWHQRSRHPSYNRFLY